MVFLRGDFWVVCIAKSSEEGLGADSAKLRVSAGYRAQLENISRLLRRCTGHCVCLITTFVCYGIVHYKPVLF